MTIVTEYDQYGTSYEINYREDFVQTLGLDTLKSIPIFPARDLNLEGVVGYPDEIVSYEKLRGKSIVKCKGENGTLFIALHVLIKMDRREPYQAVEVLFERYQHYFAVPVNIMADDGRRTFSGFGPMRNNKVPDYIKDLLEGKTIKMEGDVTKSEISLVGGEEPPVR